MSLPRGLPVPIIHENIKRKFLPSSKIAQEDYPVWENYLYQEDSQLFWKEAQDTSSWDTWACSLQSLGLSPHGWVYSMETDTWPDWERCSPQYSFYSRLTSQSSPKPMWPLPSSALILDHPWHRAASAPMVLDNPPGMNLLASQKVLEPSYCLPGTALSVHSLCIHPLSLSPVWWEARVKWIFWFTLALLPIHLSLYFYIFFFF